MSQDKALANSSSWYTFWRPAAHPVNADVTRFAEEALERHKREGLELAVRARWIGLAIVAVMLPLLNFRLEVLYFEAFLLLFAVTGWLQRRVGRVGRSGAELALMGLDIGLMTFILTVPPPFTGPEVWPTAMTYKFDNFLYFFMILASGTLMYNWRTLMAFANWTAGFWMIGVLGVWLFGHTVPELSDGLAEVFQDMPRLLGLIDPNGLGLDFRLQEIVVFLVVGYTLALSGWRFNRLLMSHAAVERERANLSRYFSPNVVEDLSRNDAPLRDVREEEVAVLFVDLVGFTEYAARRSAAEVVETLRAFHGRMEACIFENNGTLDKFLGDGLMATFGTPLSGPDDAVRALDCARSMLRATAALNEERVAAGDEPLRISIGLHVGPAVLGDIGANRLEYTVIGTTVNVASRMESLTRTLGTDLVVSREAHTRVADQGGDVQGLSSFEGQTIRGLPGTTTVWVN